MSEGKKTGRKSGSRPGQCAAEGAASSQSSAALLRGGRSSAAEARPRRRASSQAAGCKPAGSLFGRFGRQAPIDSVSGTDVKPSKSKAAVRQAGRKLKWPVIEVVLLLLLMKIGAGAWFLISGPEMARQAGPAPVAGPAAEDPLGAETEVKGQTRPNPPKNSSTIDSYLAAAVEAVASPTKAQASVPALVSVSSSASFAPFASGALMVLGGQAASPPMPQGGTEDSIPLPPGADLLTPAAELPPPNLPTVGSGVTNNRGSGSAAPLPPNAAAPIPSADIRLREQALALKEAELASREEALKALDADLRRRQAAIDNFRNEQEAMISRNEAVLGELKALREKQQQDEEISREASIQQLVAAYGAMKPEQAGALVNSLDDEVAVAILSVMSGRKAGLILANVVPEKAARLTKAISERRIDPNRVLADNPAVAGLPDAP